MWSLFSTACFSLRRPGLGKNWAGNKGSEREWPREGCLAHLPGPGLPPPALPPHRRLTLRKGTMSKMWMDQWSQVLIKSWTQS